MLLKQAMIEKGWPPGGWMFHQMETNWDAPGPLQFTFAQQVENIRKHRLANPRFPFSVDPVKISEELENYTLARLRQTYSERGVQKFLESPDEELKKKHNEWSSTSQQHQSLLGRVAESVGAGNPEVLEEWLGAGGKAVPVVVSTARASDCTNCPGNRKEGWRDLLTVAGAKALREYLSAKNQLRLSTPYDATLGMCRACGCVLELKVHTPIEHILNHLTEADAKKLASYNVHCWILKKPVTPPPCDTPASPTTNHSSA